MSYSIGMIWEVRQEAMDEVEGRAHYRERARAGVTATLVYDLGVSGSRVRAPSLHRPPIMRAPSRGTTCSS